MIQEKSITCLLCEVNLILSGLIYFQALILIIKIPLIKRTLNINKNGQESYSRKHQHQVGPRHQKW